MTVSVVLIVNYKLTHNVLGFKKVFRCPNSKTHQVSINGTPMYIYINYLIIFTFKYDTLYIFYNNTYYLL